MDKFTYIIGSEVLTAGSLRISNLLWYDAVSHGGCFLTPGTSHFPHTQG